MMRFVVFAAALFMLAGCAMFAPPQASVDRRHFLALTPVSLGRNLSMSHMVTGRYGSKTYRARYEIEVVGDRLSIVALSPLGLTLFTLVQQADNVSVDNRLGRALTIDPRYTLFDLYLTYWPSNALVPALEINGMTLEIAADNGNRTVRDAQGRKVATVTYPPRGTPGGTTEIDHFDRPYRLKIVPIGVPKER